jgi:predicted site-specific integrase-resolvase
MRPEELAKALGVSGKTLRGWLRRRFPRAAAEKSKWWTLTSAQEEAARLRFATPWRRAPSRKRMRVTTVALPEQVHRRLTAAATEERTVMTELVRQAVLEWLERRDNESVEKDEPK